MKYDAGEMSLNWAGKCHVDSGVFETLKTDGRTYTARYMRVFYTAKYRGQNSSYNLCLRVCRTNMRFAGVAKGVRREIEAFAVVIDY